MKAGDHVYEYAPGVWKKHVVAEVKPDRRCRDGERVSLKCRTLTAKDWNRKRRPLSLDCLCERVHVREK